MLRFAHSLVRKAQQKLQDFLFDYEESSSTSGHSTVIPTTDDVISVRGYLLHFVPLELADVILDDAQYWPCISVESTQQYRVDADFPTNNNAAAYYLVSLPVPKQALGIRMVKFWLSSCDQGWGGDINNLNTYNGSCTWFEAGILRDTTNGASDHLLGLLQHRNANEFNIDAFTRIHNQEIENPMNPSGRWHVQYNIQASLEIRDHKVEWYKDDTITEEIQVAANLKGAGTGEGFVNMLTAGDRVVLVVRAQYPGWANHVFGAKIELFYFA